MYSRFELILVNSVYNLSRFRKYYPEKVKNNPFCVANILVNVSIFAYFI